MVKTNQVRRDFLNYFQKQNHQVIASSPVVPHDDPTLLFTNAGMNQFKDVFLGQSVRDYKRATTSQKSIRAGGKHNDLENVGHTKRHLTFFEMLGNFSFGDYFKEQAIKFAWEVSTQVFGFNPDRIYPTVFRDDDEAFHLWTAYVPKERITRFGEKENFWAMGEFGPCGPSSELLYDRGEKFGTAKNPLEDASGERFLEYWNLVFMQFNKRADGIQEALPKPSIDTGSGLERVVSLMQDVESVFETDILRSIIQAIEEESKVKYDLKDAKRAPAFRVIADHLRSLSFAIADGAQPSNIERGYVLRKILRRAVRYGKLLGFEEPFLAKILPRLVTEMGQDYKEIVIAQSRIAEIFTREEEAFFRTLKRGGNILSQIIESSTKHQKEITGADAFKLKDTYGLPLEEVELIAKDYDLHVDVKGFQELEKQAKEKSKAAQKSADQTVEANLFEDFVAKNGTCNFVRDEKEFLESKVIGIVHHGQFVDSLSQTQEGLIILKDTLFYPEMGGQVGDTGQLANEKAQFQVTDCKAPYKGIIAHIGKAIKGSIHVGDTIRSAIDKERRQKIANNHTATHLLHYALHVVLGEHARQAGSVVDPEHLRFDFSHHKQLTDDEIKKIEQIVNEKIRENLPVQAYEIPYDEASKRHDIKQFFGEKYGSVVRVIDMDFSKELCGGTHTSRTGNIGYFRIAREASIAAGVRRIEALTGGEAEAFALQPEETLKSIAEKLKIPHHKLSERIDKMNEEMKALQSDLKNLKKVQLEKLAKDLPSKVSEKGICYVIAQVDLRPDELKLLGDELAAKLPSSVLGLGCVDAEKAHLFVKVSPDLNNKGIKAQELIKAVLPVIEGNGGGKADFAQGAGKLKEKLPKALNDLILLI
jgi:alanyl-tRNA synthetase